jgi:hypothetical protein
MIENSIINCWRPWPDVSFSHKSIKDPKDVSDKRFSETAGLAM